MGEEVFELVRLNSYRIWKLLQPNPPVIDQKDRLTIIQGVQEKETEKDDQE